MAEHMSPGLATLRARDLARQLIAFEEDARRLSRSNGVPVAGVFETLRRPLCTITGTSGFRALLARALALATPRAAGLRSVKVTPDGSYEGLDDPGVTENSEAGVELISQLLGLLGGLIGDTLLFHILVDVWPDLTAFSAESTGEREHDPTR